MKHIIATITLLITLNMLGACTVLPTAPGEEWRQEYENDKSIADNAYERGDYEAAAEIYFLHASMGSKFSQYRLAYMHERGLGVAQNVVDAYAWAHLAAEEGTRSLVNYRDKLGTRLSPSERQAAIARSEQLYDAHSTYAIMEKTYKHARRVINSCTGSRIGNSCDRLSVVPGGGSFPVSFVVGSEGNFAAQGPTVVGIPGFVYMAPYKHNLIVSREYLEQYGRVEFRDFRIVEDEVDENATRAQSLDDSRLL